MFGCVLFEGKELINEDVTRVRLLVCRFYTMVIPGLGPRILYACFYRGMLSLPSSQTRASQSTANRGGMLL